MAVPVPSETVTVMVAVPVCVTLGVTVTVLLAPDPPKTILALGTRVVFEEVPVKVKEATAVSISPKVKETAEVAVPEVVVWSAILDIVGRSLTDVTVSTKVSLAVSTPSETVTVIVDVPD